MSHLNFSILSFQKWPVIYHCLTASIRFSKTRQNGQFLVLFNKLLSTQNVEWDFSAFSNNVQKQHSLRFTPRTWSYLLLAAVFNLEPKLDRVVSLVVGLEGALLQGGLALVFFLGDFLIGESDSFLLGELLLVAGREVSTFSDMVTNTNQAYCGYSLDNFLEDVEPFESCL